MNREKAKILGNFLTQYTKEELDVLYENRKYIAAWGNGRDIQYAVPPGQWHDGVGQLGFIFKAAVYRIKPKTRRYRVALNGNSACLVYNDADANRIETSSSFNEWLSPWMEYEIPED